MARELSITAYLLVFRLFFIFFNLFPQKEKTVCVASFGDNILFTLRSLKDVSSDQVIVLAKPSCHYEFADVSNQTIPFSLKHPISFVKSIYHLATATTILIDNYEGFLAVTDFRAGTVCIQLWHAAGGIKHFGLQDPSIQERSAKAKERFLKVYHRFDYAVVGSEGMAESFRNSFGMTDAQFIRTGIPRSDILFDPAEKSQVSREISQKFPSIGDRKIILYAPTFRKEQLSIEQLAIDIEQLYKQLSDRYVLFIKLHPAVSSDLKEVERYPDFVFNVSDFKETNRLLLATDLLITDYSSIPFEYALLEKPMIFFAYDLEEYKYKSGLIDDYEVQMPGPVVFSTSEIIEKILQDSFDIDKIKDFSEKWNAYSLGDSSARLAGYLADTEEKEKEKVSS